MSVEELGSLGVFVWRVGSRNVMKLLVGEQKKRMNCFADRKGATMFYCGQL